jgi:DHA2 family multidrug resistance protein
MVHSLTAANPFIRISMFRDRNFASGNVFMFVVGVVMYATLALLPAMLQNLMGYSVFEAGLVTSPRSVGSVVAMLVIARLMGWFDRRLLISGGFLLAAVSLWEMAHFTTTMSMSKVVWAGLWQGLGVAISYVPLTALSFATLPSALRNQGTAMFNLIRNIGSSIGISMVQALLVRNTQIQHAVLAQNLTPYRVATLHSSLTYAPYSHATLPALNAAVTAQANMVAYIDDYYLMFILILLVTPVMLLVRKAAPRPTQDVAPVIEAIE